MIYHLPLARHRRFTLSLVVAGAIKPCDGLGDRRRVPIYNNL